MEERKKHIQFTAEDIRKYLDGELTGPEMQALEKAALEDPFLADAMEGYEEGRKQSVAFQGDLTDLQNRIEEKINQKKRKSWILIPMKWQVAASILFVLGTSLFTFIYVTHTTNKVKIAGAIKKDSHDIKQGQLSEISGDTTSKPITIGPSADEDAKSIVPGKPDSKKHPSPYKKAKAADQSTPSRDADMEKSQPFANKNYHKDFDSVTHPDVADRFNTEDERSTPVPLAQTPVLAGKVSGIEVTKQKQPLASQGFVSSNYVAGIVVDEKNQPVPNATVLLSHSKKGIITDSNGYFKLYLKNSDSVGQIAVNYIGYQSVSKVLKTNNNINNRIQLKPVSNSLNEVVVTGYGTVDKTENDNPDSTIFFKKRGLGSSLPDSLVNRHVVPQGGWFSYDQYLHANKKILSADSALTGTEIVTFQVNEKGEMSSFKILTSVSPAHDAEIIHLIKSGPPWKINKGNKQTCRVRLGYP